MTDPLRELAEKNAVIERIKAYCAVMTQDKRMKVMGEILLREIARIEQEEKEKGQSGGSRGRQAP